MKCKICNSIHEGMSCQKILLYLQIDDILKIIEEVVDTPLAPILKFKVIRRKIEEYKRKI